MDNFITISPAGSYKNIGAYSKVVVKLFGHASYGPSGSGGWQIVDRPKSVAATQWFDRSPMQLAFEGILDGETRSRGGQLFGYNYNGKTPDAVIYDENGEATYQATRGSDIGSFLSVDNDCKQIESWLSPVTGMNQPPVFKISGPVPGTEKNYILYGVDFGDAIRNNDSGARIQQQVKFTFYEYIPPLASGFTAFGLTPTEAFVQNVLPTAPVTQLNYVVKKGDTLLKIANKHRGTKFTAAQFVAGIKVLNQIRDDKALAKLIGKKIKLPVRPA